MVVKFIKALTNVCGMLGHHMLDTEGIDRTLTALSHVCRRRLLFELYRDLNSGDGAAINYTEITPFRNETWRIRLYHVHLPKLEEFGYITWNEADEIIRTGPEWDELEPILEFIYAHHRDLPLVLQGKPPDGDGPTP